MIRKTFFSRFSPLFFSHFFCFFSFFVLNSLAYETSLSALYKSLDPKSIAKQLAFFELYPKTEEGQQALKTAFFLLKETDEKKLSLPKLDPSFLIRIINSTPAASNLDLKEEELLFIEKISRSLSNRKLKTFKATEEKSFWEASPEELDLARGLLIAQIGSTPEDLKKIRLYEATLDLMALQIKAKLPEKPRPLEKIRAISDFIFFEMGFAFPPHSSFSEKIDSFTYLPSVIDSKKGVCLGISILYLALAQRLDLPLEAVTPPGHIFLRYKEPQAEELNIETTMRGVHIPTEEYLGIELKKLPLKSLKAVIGMAFVNEASLFLKDKKFHQAAALYQKAQKYLPEDPLIQELLGFCYLLTKKEKKGLQLLKQVALFPDEDKLAPNNLVLDVLEKRIDKKGLSEFFVPYEDNIKALSYKKQKLEKHLKKHPRFKAGLMLLASINFEMGRHREAYLVLEQ
ncbi:MAG: transglutaminase family protein, partial [Parachlamydiales bacterium]